MAKRMVNVSDFSGDQLADEEAILVTVDNETKVISIFHKNKRILSGKDLAFSLKELCEKVGGRLMTPNETAMLNGPWGK